MKTGNQSVDDVYGLLIGVNGVTGSIFKYKRPLNSKKVDVVINSLTLNASVLQQGIVNINIHAPNRTDIKFDGVSDNSFADNLTLEYICGQIIPMVDCQWKETFHTDVDTAPNMLQDSDGTWYINIRVNYYSVINDFKNI